MEQQKRCRDCTHSVLSSYHSGEWLWCPYKYAVLSNESVCEKFKPRKKEQYQLSLM